MIPGTTTLNDVKRDVDFFINKQATSEPTAQKVTTVGNFKLFIDITAPGEKGKFMYKLNGIDKIINAGSSTTEELNSILGIKKETVLSDGGSRQATFTFLPGPTTKSMKAKLRLTDEEEKPVGNVVELVWEASTHKQVRIELPDPNNTLFKGNDSLSIKLLNEGAAINTDELFIVLTITPPSGYSSPQFKVGASSDVYHTKLTQILGKAGSILNTQDSVSFDLLGLQSDRTTKFYNSNVQVDLQLQVWCGKEKLNSRDIKWRNKKTQVQFVEPVSDNVVVKGTDAMKIQLKNTGETAISLKGLRATLQTDGQLWDDYVQIQCFRLGGKKVMGPDVYLIDIIEENMEVLQPSEIVTFSLQLPIQPHNITKLDFPLEIRGDGYGLLGTRTINWQAKKIQVAFMSPEDNAVLQGKETMQVVLKNTGEADIDLDELSICLRFKEQPNGSRPSFDLENHIMIGGYFEKLSDLTIKNDAKLQPNDTLSLDLKRYKYQYRAMANQEYKMELQVQFQSNIIATKDITAKKENIQMEFVTPATDGELFIGSNPLIITLKNTGDDVSTDDLSIGLFSTNVNPTRDELIDLTSMFNVGSEIVHFRKGKNLTNILEKNAFVFQQGSTVTFKLTKNILPFDKAASFFHAWVAYEEGCIASSKLIKWQNYRIL